MRSARAAARETNAKQGSPGGWTSWNALGRLEGNPIY